MSVISRRNVQKIRSLTLIVVGVFLIGASIADAAEPRTRTSRIEKRQQLDAEKLKTAQDDAKNIDTALTKLLTNVNEQNYPDKKDNAITAEVLKTTIKSLKSFDENAQCQYFMLQAWNDCFTGDKDRALKGSMKAYKTNPRNNDAKLTHTAMAILNNKTPVKIDPEKTKTTSRQRGSSRTRSRQPAGRHMEGTMGPGYDMGMGQPMGPGYGMGARTASHLTTAGSGDILQFDADALSVELLSETIKPMQVDCLNATVFSYSPQDTTLCAMIWSMGLEKDSPSTETTETTETGNGIADPNDAEKKRQQKRQQKKSEIQRLAGPMDTMGLMPIGPMGPMGLMGNRNLNPNQNDPMLRQMDAFGKLFADNFDNYATQFVAVNIDKSKKARSEVLKEAMKNPWPWAQVVANGQAEKVGMKIPDTPEGLRTAILVIADSTGSVRYAGPAEGFLAPLLLNDLAPTSQAPAKRKTFSVKPIKKETAQAGKIKAKKVQDEEYFDPQAEKLLENAKGFIKIGRFTTYKKGINMCRQVINDYPNTRYEQQARDILRRVPEGHRKKYRITDADLGL